MKKELIDYNDGSAELEAFVAYEEADSQNHSFWWSMIGVGAGILPESGGACCGNGICWNGC
ncbi:MAG: hypothetical protein Ct9H90mP25_6220 [Gammaproteobacteria bacterium]|nr:MAG: hypothetical protein Ct9H90mP25_6220 [Gammaproteobacteria bacterium]